MIRAQALDLSFLRYAADYERGLGHVFGAQALIDFVNLHGQFARGQKHQSAGLGRGFVAKHFDNRDEKG